MSLEPSGWTCHALRAPGAKETVAPPTREPPESRKALRTVTCPVKLAPGPGRASPDPRGTTFVTPPTSERVSATGD